MIPRCEDEKAQSTERERERERESAGRPRSCESELMLANTKRFLEQLSESDTDSQRYVSRLKENLEHELRRRKLRTELSEDPN